MLKLHIFGLVTTSVVPGLNPLRVTVFRKSKLRALKWHKPDLSIFISNQVMPSLDLATFEETISILIEDF